MKHNSSAKFDKKQDTSLHSFKQNSKPFEFEFKHQDVSTYMIVAQFFIDGKTIFRLKNKKNNDFIDKTASAIYADSDLLESLNSKDAHLIGYVSASENIIAELSQLYLS